MVFFWFLLFFLVLSMPITYAYPYYRLEKDYLNNDFRVMDDVEAIVILGAGLRYSSSMQQPNVSLSLLARIRFGAYLQRETSLPILVTGGGAYVGHSEAEVMKQVLEDEFHATVDFFEDRSKTTKENAEYSLKILREEGIKSIFLVSNSWHLKRADVLFNQYAEEIKIVPIADFHYIEKKFILEWEDFFPNLSTLYYVKRMGYEYMAGFLLKMNISR
jgi:uncharacterized SAM-binding protein YcdF (DUF218 family)